MLPVMLMHHKFAGYMAVASERPHVAHEHVQHSSIDFSTQGIIVSAGCMAVTSQGLRDCKQLNLYVKLQQQQVLYQLRYCSDGVRGHGR